MVIETRFKGVFELKQKKKKILLTKNLAKGIKFFSENLYTIDNIEYREFDPKRSKIAAAIAKGISQLGVYPESKVLYLGASHGYTCSFISDIVGEKGFVFALDFAPRSTRDLVFVCQDRLNICPVIADANKPESYYHYVSEVDTIIQDIAQKNQAEIFLKNCKMFLKKNGFGVLVVKSRSIDVTKKPKEVFKQIREKLEKEITIVDYRELQPFEMDHCVFVCKKK